MADADAIDARISPDCPQDVQAVLRAAWCHDTAALKPLLKGLGKANCRDPATGESPLHAAIRSMGAGSGSDEEMDMTAAEATVRQLLTAGAIWNDVDDHNETPGCVAWRLGRPALYELCVNAGVRAEMLFAVLGGYEELSSGDEDEDDEGVMVEEEGTTAEEDVLVEEDVVVVEAEKTDAETEETKAEAPYLESHLTLTDGKLVDAAGNGVMMAWETDIMRRSVDGLLGDAGEGKRVLNIGFGLGIIDSMLAARRPARHHIIEAHPDVLARLDRPAEAQDESHDHAADFGVAWEATGPQPGAFKVHRGRWQDLCPVLLAQGELYDAIYFDTFGEDYAQLHRFFSDYIPGLLHDDGVFGFFHGLGADRRICYDVYTRVVEMHLSEAGFDVTWHDVDVALADDGLDAPGKGAWEGIVRPYWTLDKYRLPVCTFMG
ncbi:arginine n-methyltransferase [Grosmannia clavigera kw1407]|uniref:Arginine N-methyltransferase 2 n=1 Tax=Grosmannia clavigera (strain kw1407 / UAMH 11150) TaxID=655863 RepID=F0XE57_GROCL|nr:arginine n-methyltransferase [Grosmannia clavigera kw1407]EFX03918.1 arginine n-methyltransferase [Grosmannia clavigera kw1407]